jgi:tetratricopeptide (TPR) repeat protein
MRFTYKHWLLIGGSIALLILIYLAPKTKVGGAPQVAEATVSEDHLKPYIDSVMSSLSAEDKALFRSNERYFKVSADSITSFWNSRRHPELAGYYMSVFSKEHDSKENWMKTGNSFFLATRMDLPERGHFYEQAIIAYEKALEKDPNDLDIKTRLGVCYVEGTDQPMRGIGLLRDVVTKDSTKTEAQINLALFAIQSGQYDKAINRLERLAKMKPDFAEAYLYLGQTYATMGEKDKAVKALSRFSDMTNDSLVRSEVEKYIYQLKNS